MEFSGCFLLRIGLAILSSFLLAQLPTTSASGLLKDLNACGNHHISYSDDAQIELFYLNGELVDRVLFCEALKYYQVNQCFIDSNVGHQYCGLDSSLGMVYLALLLYIYNLLSLMFIPK